MAQTDLGIASVYCAAMLFVAVPDADLVKQVGDAVAGRKWYETSSRDPQHLLEQAAWAKPRVVIADVRYGGGSWRITESISELLQIPSRPEIVLLSPWTSSALTSSAAASGVYDVVDLDVSDWGARLAGVVGRARACQIENSKRGRRSGLVRH